MIGRASDVYHSEELAAEIQGMEMRYETRYENPKASMNASEGTLGDYKIRMFRVFRNLRDSQAEPIEDLANNAHTILSNSVERATKSEWTISAYAEAENVDLVVLNDLEVKLHGKNLWLTPTEYIKQTRRRILQLGAAFIFILLILLWKTAYLSLSTNNRNNTNLALMTRTPPSLAKLEDQSKLINEMSHHIGDYRLKDITDLLSDTATIATDVNLEFKAELDAWTKINANAATDAQAYRDLQSNVAATSQLQAKEIDRLHEVLVKAEKPSLIYSIAWLFFSFVIGVLTSITADKLKDKVNLIFNVISLKLRLLRAGHGK